jgi:hypothetical protein
MHEGIAFEQSEAGKVVCLTFKLIRHVRCECFLAILEKTEEFLMSRDIVMAGLMKLEKGLFRLNDSSIYMDEVVSCIIEAEDFRDS